QLAEDVEQLLRPAHGKGRNHYRAAARRRRFHNRGQAGAKVVGRVQAVAVGRFAQQNVGTIRHHRLANDDLMVAPEVAREEHSTRAAVFLDRHLNHARAQDVSGAIEPQGIVRRKLEGLRLVYGAKRFERLHRLGVSVKRQGWLVLAEALLIGVRRVFFLKVTGVGQDQVRQVHRRRRGQYLPAEAVFDQTGNVADVVKMRVRQRQPADARGRER